MSQSLYSINAYIDDNNDNPDPPGPTPSPTPDSLQDGVNNLSILTNTSLTIPYYSHIIPYTVSVANNTNNSFCI